MVGESVASEATVYLKYPLQKNYKTSKEIKCYPYAGKTSSRNYLREGPYVGASRQFCKAVITNTFRDLTVTMLKEGEEI